MRHSGDPTLHSSQPDSSLGSPLDTMLTGIGLSRTSTRLSTPTTDKLQHPASLISSSSAHRTLLRDDSEINTDRTDGSQPLSSNTCLLDTKRRCPTTKVANSLSQTVLALSLEPPRTHDQDNAQRSLTRETDSHPAIQLEQRQASQRWPERAN